MKETVCMKCQILFSTKKKKYIYIYISSLSSAEFGHSMVSVSIALLWQVQCIPIVLIYTNWALYPYLKNICFYICFFFFFFFCIINLVTPTSNFQLTWSRLLIQIHIQNDKQCRSRSVGFFRSQLIWIYTVCKDRIYPGSAGQGLY